MAKTVSIIGPDSQRVAVCAEKLRESVPASVTVIAGAGPEARPDIVIAVVGEPTGEDLDIARAVAGSVGFVVLIVDATTRTWPHYPGWHSVDSVEEAAALVVEACVDVTAWVGDAQRADAERLDRVRMAIRLAAHRISAELVGERPGDPGQTRGSGGDPGVATEDAEWIHRCFVHRLRLAVAEQGVHFPCVDTDVVRAETLPAVKGRRLGAGAGRSVGKGASTVGGAAKSPRHMPTVRIPHWGLAALGGLAGAAGVGALLYRVTSSATAAFAVALVVWCGLVGVRLWLVRSKQREAQRVANACYLREVWLALVTDVVARLHIPRIADTLPAIVTRPLTPAVTTSTKGINAHER